MAIITNYHSKNITIKLIRQTNLLLKKDTIPLPAIEHDEIFIASIFEIQQIKNYNEPEIKTSSPEGYRVLLRYKNNIVAAIDYYYKGRRLFFSHSFDGYLLEQLISALNAVQKLFRNSKENQKICFVQFFHAEQPYLIVFTDTNLSIYTYNEKLNKVSKEQLKNKLSKLQLNIQPI